MNTEVKRDDRDYVEWTLQGKRHTSKPIRGGGAASTAVFNAKVALGAERVQLFMGKRIVKSHFNLLK